MVSPFITCDPGQVLDLLQKTAQGMRSTVPQRDALSEGENQRYGNVGERSLYGAVNRPRQYLALTLTPDSQAGTPHTSKADDAVVEGVASTAPAS